MRLRLLVLALTASAALAGAAHAADSSVEDRLRDQLRSTVTELRALQDGQAALQAESDSLKGQLQAAKARPSAPRRDPAMQRQLAQARQAASDSLADKAKTETELSALKSSYDQLAAQARALQGERDALKATVSERDQSLTLCKDKNARLVDISHEILDRYSRSSVVGAALRKEPFIGAERAKLENQAEAYGDRIYDQKYDAPPAKQPVAP